MLMLQGGRVSGAILRGVDPAMEREVSEIADRIVEGSWEALRPGGLLFISHVESLHGLDTPLAMIRPSIFQRPSERRGAP